VTDKVKGDTMSKREEIEERMEADEVSALFMDNYDDAIIGLTQTGTSTPKVVYSRQMCIDILMRDADDDNEDAFSEAVEFFDYNSVRACEYMGKDSPVIVDDVFMY
jgi:hypothetical protein